MLWFDTGEMPGPHKSFACPLVLQLGRGEGGKSINKGFMS